MIPETNPPNASTTSATTGQGRHTLWFLLTFYAIAIVWGMGSVSLRASSPALWLLQCMAAICLARWAVDDARQRRHPIPLTSQSWFLVFAWFLVPGYVVWSRGWRGIGWVLLHAVCWSLVLIMTTFAFGTIAYMVQRRLAAGG
jgi:hypothetical protein